MVVGPLTEFIEQGQVSKDETCLGRWSVMTFKGNQGRTLVVCSYNPCYNNNPDSTTLYQQHQRFLITKKKDLTCPRRKFREDLIGQLKRWRKEGDRLIVCLDANEDIYEKALGKALTDIDGLAMKEVVGEFTQKPVGAMYFRGSKPIDGV